MMDHAVRHQDITLKLYRQDLHQVEWLNRELLRWVAALEHGRGNLIIIPDSPELIPVMDSELGGCRRVLRDDLRPLENTRERVRKKDGVGSGPAVFYPRILRPTLENFGARVWRIGESKSLFSKTLTMTEQNGQEILLEKQSPDHR